MSETAPELTVDSATGIEVSLPLAGAGARSFAFVVDWHIRVVLAFAWFAAAALIYNGRLSLTPPLDNDARWFGVVVVPALVLYFLYHPLLEVFMRGSTPGKRLAGVRVLARDGSAPSVGALLVRNVFRLVDSLPIAYGLGLTLVVLTREHLRCGDMAAGTLLVYERAGSELALTPSAGAAGSLDLASAEIAAELLARWDGLAAAARSALARELLRRRGRTSEEVAHLEEADLRRALAELTRAGGVTA